MCQIKGTSILDDTDCGDTLKSRLNPAIPKEEVMVSVNSDAGDI